MDIAFTPSGNLLPLGFETGYRGRMADGQAGKNHAADGNLLVQAQALRCPLPALALARAVREGGPGRYRLLADDPAAIADIPALCAERGWKLAATGDGWFDVIVS